MVDACRRCAGDNSVYGNGNSCSWICFEIGCYMIYLNNSIPGLHLGNDCDFLFSFWLNKCSGSYRKNTITCSVSKSHQDWSFITWLSVNMYGHLSLLPSLIIHYFNCNPNHIAITILTNHNFQVLGVTYVNNSQLPVLLPWLWSHYKLQQRCNKTLNSALIKPGTDKQANSVGINSLTHPMHRDALRNSNHRRLPLPLSLLIAHFVNYSHPTTMDRF